MLKIIIVFSGVLLFHSRTYIKRQKNVSRAIMFESFLCNEDIDPFFLPSLPLIQAYRYHPYPSRANGQLQRHRSRPFLREEKKKCVSTNILFFYNEGKETRRIFRGIFSPKKTTNVEKISYKYVNMWILSSIALQQKTKTKNENILLIFFISKKISPHNAYESNVVPFMYET